MVEFTIPKQERYLVIDQIKDYIDSLREKVSADLRLRTEEKAKSDFEERVIEAVIDLAQVEFPPVLVEAEIDWLLNQQSKRWQMSKRSTVIKDSSPVTSTPSTCSGNAFIVLTKP